MKALNQYKVLLCEKREQASGLVLTISLLAGLYPLASLVLKAVPLQVCKSAALNSALPPRRHPERSEGSPADELFLSFGTAMKAEICRAARNDGLALRIKIQEAGRFSLDSCIFILLTSARNPMLLLRGDSLLPVGMPGGVIQSEAKDLRPISCSSHLGHCNSGGDFSRRSKRRVSFKNQDSGSKKV